MPAIIGGVIAVAIIVATAFVLLRSPEPIAEEPDPSASPSPSAPASPTAPPSEAPPSANPDPTPLAAPDEWTQVHTFGDGSTRWAGGEIAWGDAGFVAIGRRYESTEGGP